jgi:hypothetical protein
MNTQTACECEVSKYGDFRIGLVLYTKDGRRFGNAIVTGIKLVTDTTNVKLKGTAQITIESDFGNVVRINSSVIGYYFYIVPESIQDISEWRKSKIRNSARYL